MKKFLNCQKGDILYTSQFDDYYEIDTFKYVIKEITEASFGENQILLWNVDNNEYLIHTTDNLAEFGYATTPEGAMRDFIISIKDYGTENAMLKLIDYIKTQERNGDMVEYYPIVTEMLNNLINKEEAKVCALKSDLELHELNLYSIKNKLKLFNNVVI